MGREKLDLTKPGQIINPNWRDKDHRRVKMMHFVFMLCLNIRYPSPDERWLDTLGDECWIRELSL